MLHNSQWFSQGFPLCLLFMFILFVGVSCFRFFFLPFICLLNCLFVWFGLLIKIDGQEMVMMRWHVLFNVYIVSLKNIGTCMWTLWKELKEWYIRQFYILHFYRNSIMHTPNKSTKEGDKVDFCFLRVFSE